MAFSIGMNTVVFGSSDLEAALQQVQWAGFECVELACLPGMAAHVDPGMSPEARKEARAAIEASGLRVVAMEAATNILDQDRRAWFIQALELARDLGVPTVSTGTGGQMTDVDYERSVAAARELAEAGRRTGVRVAIKAHVNQAVHNAKTARSLADAVGSEWLGVNYDPTHLFREGDDVLAALDVLKGAIAHVHFRDVAGGGKQIGPPETQAPGCGVLDLGAIWRKLHAIGYDRAVDLEIIGAHGYEPERASALAGQARGFFRRLEIEAAGAQRAVKLA
ncbi:MAG TPA: sugar phosphate isomerase/epimerase [Limnochordia bacterium]|nr:sugar phosphate isomerase/epimerase [Limnochordia bacterium]